MKNNIKNINDRTKESCSKSKKARDSKDYEQMLMELVRDEVKKL